MKHLLGEDSEAFLKALASATPVSIRLNPEKLILMSEDKVNWCRYGYYLSERPVFTLDPLFHAGAYYVQEASSMFIEQIIIQLGLDKKPVRALDVCAAPGGKTTHLLSLLPNESLIVSNDVIKSRIPVLRENIIKWGNANCVITNNDSADFNSLENFFDLVVCDAPCSGEGLFRKDIDAISHWSPEHVEFCSARQKRIVSAVWNSLKSGGIFVYCTCTYNEQENEEVIGWINAQCTMHNAQLKIIASDILISEKNEISFYRFYPHKIYGEGFCISVMKKEGIYNTAAGKIKKEKIIFTSEKHLNILSSWIHQPERFEFIQNGPDIMMLHKEHLPDYLYLKKNLKIGYAGTRIALIKGTGIQPAPELAFCHHLNQNIFKRCNLSKTDALRYLKGATDFSFEANEGYYLMLYENIPLGFAKKTGNRFNNLFPREWYIRMEIRHQ